MNQRNLIAALVPAGLAVFALGCRAATPAAIAPTPVAAPSEVAAVAVGTLPPEPHSTRRPGSTAASTARPTPTPTARPMSSATPNGPLPVQMTLKQAEEEVRSWWIPELEARILRSAYVTKADIRAVLSPDEYLYLNDLGPYHRRHEVMESEYIADPLIMVEVVQPGLAQLVAERFRDRACLPPTGDDRYTTFFAAQEGVELGVHRDHVPESLWNHLAASPVAVVHVPQLSPTPFPTVPGIHPKLTPGVPPPIWTREPPYEIPSIWTREPPREMAVGEVPAALGDSARTLPWVVGSSWTYRLTEVLDMVRWSTGTVTERIVKATRLGPDIVEVHFERSQSLVPQRSSRKVNPWDSAVSHHDRAFVVPTGAVLMLSESLALDDFRARIAALGERREAWTAEYPLEILRLPLQTPEQYNYWWRVVSEESVRTPAGDFPGAHTLDHIVSVGDSWTHWLAPGVGFVRHELAGFGAGAMCSFTVLELTDYHVPPWVEVP